MYFEEIGHQVRKARKAKGMTQSELAQATHLSRTTVNQMEAGIFPDLGVRKLLAILEVLGLDLSVAEKSGKEKKTTDFLAMACISANVSYRGRLDKQELAQTLMTGKVLPEKRPQLRVIFDELPPSVFAGMVNQVCAWGSEQKIRKNIADIATQIQSSRQLAA